MTDIRSTYSLVPSENTGLPELTRNGGKPIGREASNERYAQQRRDYEAELAAKADPRNFNLSKVQFHAILHAEGLFDPIKAAIEGMPATTPEEKLAKGKAMSDFLHANPIHRDNPLFTSVGETLGLTDEQIDGLWMIAKDL